MSACRTAATPYAKVGVYYCPKGEHFALGAYHTFVEVDGLSGSDVVAQANDPGHPLYDALWLGLAAVPDDAADVCAFVEGVELDLNDPETAFALR